MKNKLLQFTIVALAVSLLSCVAPVAGEAHTLAFLMKLFSPDAIPPRVSFTSPTAIDDEFEVNKAIIVAFSKSIVSEETSHPIQLSLEGTPVSGTTEFINNSITFKPDTNLENNKEYSIEIKGVQDEKGNKMEGRYAFTFKTQNLGDTTPISIKAISPEANRSNVELDAKIAIEFNETLSPKSVLTENFILTANGTNVEYTFEYAGNILYIVPTQEFSPYTYHTLTISGNIQDTANLTMGSDYTMNFLTANAKDKTPPKVTESFPEVSPISPAIRNQQMQVSSPLLNTTTSSLRIIEPPQFLMINFSEAITKAIPDQSIILRNLGTNQNVEFGIKRGLSSVTVFPLNKKWEDGYRYNLAILSQVSDLSENTLANGQFNFPFLVGDTGALPPPPELIGQIPANLEQNVGLRVKIKLIFSEAIFFPSVSIDSARILDNSGSITEGTYSFDDSKTFSFKPNHLLKPLTTYTVQLKASIRGLLNEKIPLEHTFQFTTEELISPSALAYSSEYFNFTEGLSSPPISPSFNGYVTDCISTPALPTGIYLLPNCTIYGSPQNSQSVTEYTITASNTNGSTNTKLFISVAKLGEQPLFFSYSFNSYSFVKDRSISSINPTKVGIIISCQSTPPLPTGLRLGSDCKISGTPTLLSTPTSYSIQASSGSMSMTRTISITVSDTAISYPLASYELVKNGVTYLTPTIDSSTTSCTVTPSLPTGLSLDSKNCKISGAPTTYQTSNNYTVTASSNSGSGSTTISILVRAPKNCKEILDYGLSTGDGVYYIDVDGLAGLDSIRTYCEMTLDGGGWTLGFIKNSKESGSYLGFASYYRNMENLQFDPKVASNLDIPVVGWLNANDLTYTNMRVVVYSNGALSYSTINIPKSELRINFGQSGYLLYNATSEGYYWCGGISDFTDNGTYEDNPVSGTTTTRDCKGHWAVGTGWDFSKTNTLNQGLTLCSVEAGYNFMYRGLGTGLIYYGTVGAAYALWFR